MYDNKISVIVPVYNIGQYLESSIKSLINQTYRNIEIILVDDGSVDNSPAICDLYAEKDNRIKVIHQKNKGVSAARNAGMRVATGIEEIHYTLKEYDGVSAKDGAPPSISIVYSTKWIEKSFANNDTAKVDYETRGVLYHELTHGFQLEPQGIGSYGTNKTFWAMIEGVADAVRYLNGGFTLEDRPKGGHYMDGYRTTGFFLAWLTQTKNPDFLRKFNRSTLEVIPWSFDGGVKYALGNDYDIDSLWKEYMATMGDEA